MRPSTVLGLILGAVVVRAQDVSNQKIEQLNASTINQGGQIDTTDNGVEANASLSLRAGPRGFNLLQDTSVRKKIIHFGHERAPERVVHALGFGAYGQFQSYGDWSNITMACWLQSGAVSEVFSRFSVVASSNGGSDNSRDTHGFATKIYSQCGNQDLVGNHVPSFFINDGAAFPDLVHAVKPEPNKGFPNGGTAHTTAYDFFNQHPEGAFQLMTVLSDLGLPRDIRHISGNGVHTYRFINSQGQSQLYKWYWMPSLGHRSLVYPEVTTLQGKNNNFQRMDLYNNIEAGNFPEWEFAVQLFPDDGTYMYQDYDLTIPTQIVPFEVVEPLKLGKLTLNRNFRNFFAEPESISFAPSNVVDGINFVPDPLLQWRLESYDDTSTHRHNSANGYLLPINRPIAPVNNNYRDGYMQPYIYEGESISTPNTLGGIVEPDQADTLAYGPSSGFMAGSGNVGRYKSQYDWFGQARMFYSGLDQYAQQHLVDGYRFEVGNVANASVAQAYVDQTLNPIDNCLARRVAYGIGAALPAIGSGPMSNNSGVPKYPSLYPLAMGVEPNKSNVGLNVAVIANNTLFSSADYNAMMSLLSAQKVFLTVVAPYMGELQTGINATASYITASSVFYDAVFIGSMASAQGSNSSGSGTAQGNNGSWSSWSSTNTGTGTNAGTGSSPGALMLDSYASSFIMEAYSNGKAVGALGSSGPGFLAGIGLSTNNAMGVYSGDAATVTNDVLMALSGPVRFPQRFPTDDIQAICGSM